MNPPDPEPLAVILSEVVGLDDVLQQTPLAVTGAPPSEVTFPPLVAVACVMLVAVSVVTVGNIAVKVVKLISFP